MCMQPTRVRPAQKWGWAGHQIVHDPVIPASRTVPGTRRARYPIDIRAFLSIEGNAAVRAWLDRLRSDLTAPGLRRFNGRGPGDFDARVDLVTAYMRRHLRHQRSSRHFDQWRFPEETLAAGGGDCEDLAFVLTALLEGAGVSVDCLRVVLGEVIEHRPGGPRTWDHAWVVYQNEKGAWEILEPLGSVRPAAPSRRRRSAADVEYLPHFVFNRHHLWRVRSPATRAGDALPSYLVERTFWAGFNPSFAIGVHEHILDLALAAMPADLLQQVKRWNSWVDVDVLAYDPRDHFDFAYVEAGWERVEQRLTGAKAKLAQGYVRDFTLATHAVADFYAHTLYADFVQPHNGSLPLYDPDSPLPSGSLVYDFTPYRELPGCSHTALQAQEHWKGALISGQWWRWYTTYPDELETAAELEWRRCLPDHDAIAVDSATPKSSHTHYAGAQYARQFALRQQAAIEHVRELYKRATSA